MSYSIVRVDDEPNNPRLSEFILDSTSDVGSLPTDVAPGSVAATADLVHVYRLSNSGVWVEVGG